MRALEHLTPPKDLVLLCDIDDTLTNDGRLGKAAYSSLWDLFDQGVKIIPVTGRPAGWCELIARQWPVDGVIGENGAFYFRYHQKKMQRYYVSPPSIETKEKLAKIEQEILRDIPGTAVASDQFCRLFDLAIDFCEDVDALSESDIGKIVDVFKAHGATAKVSSIHVNGWYGDFDKLTTAKKYLAQEVGLKTNEIQHRCIFIGDSPNDEPMFEYFENSVGVANILRFQDRLKSKPGFVTTKSGGDGFAQLSQYIVDFGG